MKTADKVVLSWCDPGQVDGQFAVGVAQVYADRHARIGAIIRTKGGLITRQRNETVRTFLATPHQWLMMVDCDERFNVPAFDKLIDAAHDKDRPALSGLVFAAYQGDLYPTPVPTIYRIADDGFYVPIDDYPPDSVFEVGSAGGGFFLVHRTVLEKIRENAPEDAKDWCWFRDGPVANRWLSEDHYFWRQVRAAGFPIHAHTGAILPHHKQFWLDDRHHKEAHRG